MTSRTSLPKMGDPITMSKLSQIADPYITGEFVQKVEPYLDQKATADWDPLRKYNMILCIIHIVIAVVLIIYFSRVRKSGTSVEGINLDLFRHAFTLNADKTFFEVVSKKISDVSEDNVINLIITFFAITAGFHLLYAINPGNIYLDAVKNGNNFLRWIEYGLSATIMIVIIALLSGVKDIKNYLLLVVSSIAIMSTGQWFETSTGKSRWIPIMIGFTILGGVFATIFSAFKERINESKEAGFNVPSWIYAVVFIMFGFYASFGFVPVGQMILGGSYRRYEYIYLTLSLVSKASLGLLVAIGFGQRSKSSVPS